MSDRLKAAWVVFDHDLGEEDAAAVMDAIRMIRGVLSVGPSVSDSTDWMARERVRAEILKKLLDVLAPDRDARPTP